MDSRRIRLAALIGVVLLAAALQLPLWSWEVEDSAIDFAYARNLALGNGLVPQVGAERVEGFSNPTWVALLAALHWLGLDPFVASRWLGLLMGCAVVPLVYQAVRPIAKDPPYGPLAAAAAIGLFAPHAIWSQSGLENPLFSLLLALGCFRAARAGNHDVLGPLIFAGVALTRPEGVVYAVAAAITSAAAARGPYGARTRLLTWAIVLAVPLLAAEGLRVWYFAQELPATYHAKLGNADVQVLNDASRGWRQIGGLAKDTGAAALVPLLVFGASGAEGWKARAAAVVCGLFLLAFALGSTVAATGVVLLSLPILAMWRRPPVGLAVALILAGLAFHLGAGGDWMRGYRFLSLVAVPAAVLIGIGVGELADRIDSLRHGPLVALGFALLPQILYVARYERHPETSPGAVERRLAHYLEVARRLQLERRPRVVDHDMGGLLWFGGDRVWIRDTRGLVDLPFALYGPRPAVVDHELLREPRFDLAHLHASTRAALMRRPDFRAGYVEIEGYGPFGSEHDAQFARRDLFLTAGWDGPANGARFQGGIELRGVAVPSPEVAADSGLYVELGLTRGDGRNFRVVLFLTDGASVHASWELPPAYDWVPPAEWRPGEVFHGRFSLRTPVGLPSGEYGLGVVIFGEDGSVRPAADPTAPAYLPTQPVLARGELRVPAAVRIVSRDEMNRLALADRSEALRLAADARCEEAEAAWVRAIRHRTRSGEWRSANGPDVWRGLARCWAGRAEAGSVEGEALLARVRELQTARSWDPREPLAWKVGDQVAAVAHERAVAAGEPRARFMWAEAAVRADPRRSWDRRLAEKARRTWTEIDRDPDSREE